MAPEAGQSFPVLSILNSIGVAIAAFDRQWRYVFVNKTAESMSQRNQEELLGQVLWDVFPQLRETNAYAACQRAARLRVHESYADYYAPLDLWVEADVWPSDEGFVIVVRQSMAGEQVAEQSKQLARTLSHRIREFETVLEAIPVGIGISNDPECRDIRINPAFATLLQTDVTANASKTSVQDLPFRIFHRGIELQAHDLPMQLAASEARNVDEFELEVERADGSVVTELAFARPLFDEHQNVRGSLGVFFDITERKRSEQALRESEARYRFLAEAMPQTVWIAALDLTVKYINQRWCTYTGLTLEQTQQGGWSSVIHPDDLAHVVDKATVGQEQKREYEAEYRIRRASDQTWRWHFARSRIVRMEDGTEQWLGTAIDIDDRKRLEKRLEDLLSSEQVSRRRAEETLAVQRQIEKRLLLLVEASSALIESPESEQVLKTIVNLSRRFVDADAYAVWRQASDAERWDVLASEGLSEAYGRTMRSDNAKFIPQETYAVEDVEESVSLRHRLPHYRTEGIRALLTIPLRIHGRINGTLVFYYRQPHKFTEMETRVAGGLGNLAAAALGVAELYGVQTALTKAAEASERRAEFLAEAGNVLASSLDYEETLSAVAALAVPAMADWAAVDILDPDGNLRRVAVKHIDPEKIALGHEYSKRYPASKDSVLWRVLRRGVSELVEEITPEMLAGSISAPEQLALLQALGLTSVIIVPLLDNGRALGALTFVSAESGRHFTKSDLLVAEQLATRASTAVVNAHLYRASKETEEALQRTNRELQRANSDLNQFAYSASHDLREPLRMVSIFSQMLARKCENLLDQEVLQYVNYITQGSTRMEELIKDILDFTQAANISDEAITPSSAAEALSKALAALKTSIGEAGAVIHAGPLPALRVQEVHLVQIFQNLIGNAVKYRSEAPPSIYVTAARQNDYWLISVRDNGIGIAPKYADQIFGLFKRLHTADQYPGTGIGLAICQKIVERYGGRIQVESEPSHGSVFSFTLPAADNE